MFETAKFSLIGNNLFLDFVNTQKMRDASPFETLESFADFVAWMIAVKLLEPGQAEDLFKKWIGQSSTVKFFEETLKFRNLLRELAENIADQKEISNGTITAINARLKKQSGFTQIEKSENGFEKRFRFDLSEPAKLLQPIAEAVADFLCYGNFEFLRKCESASCVLFFYDTTKNHKRRWCSMKACGNQAKAAAFYKRKKQAAQVQN
ncbi:MAG TPA: CGNR zinc finger domain-containing protein [Pyrinomonadaceae bacterium]|jgi:predicted RNA-binding Zn ribbon-like protein|nr:CGNR zinc finger domain-containing protein [Pyrinomonadaceae bacterium]